MKAIVLIGLLALAGCNYRNEKESVAGAPLGRAVGFSEVREKVFQKYCNECHSTRGPVLTEYPTAKQGTEGIRKSVLVERRMPPNAALPPDARAILQAWLDSGAPEGDPAPLPTPSPEPTDDGKAPELVRWGDVKEQVFRRSCTQCHFTGNQLGREPLDSADAVRMSVGSVLGLSIMDQMPPEGERPMTKAQKLLLSRWIIDGMQD
jgi:cytochrome c5